MQKNKMNVQEYELSIEVTVKKGYILSGQSMYTGDNVLIGVYVEKAFLSSGAIAIFQRYHRSENVTFSGVKEISIHMKNGKVYNLWYDCEDKTVSYNEQTDEAVTYILFAETIPLKKIEAIEIEGQKFEI
ncbi:hypothetical protein [Clostridium sp. MD294]|uniref:hypothetical protein n=1 Tax=Clostridium sp. MD294 TaxID=97138 RepID=UPI0002CB2149|nr:hypothetical protein [Clostridium sp. MD294]USF29864.1 hypothetical protein C820_001272 [Clostridium sp. MD294]